MGVNIISFNIKHFLHAEYMEIQYMLDTLKSTKVKL